MDVLKKILSSETTYYIIVPLTITFLGWLKSRHDSQLENIRGGYWKINRKFEYPFLKIAEKTFVIDTIFLYISFSLNLAFFPLKMKFWQYIMLFFIQFALHLFLIASQLKRPAVRSELLKHKKMKIFMLLIIGIILFFPILLTNSLLAMIIWSMVLLLWFVLAFTLSDMITIYNRSYADIYINGGMELKNIKVNQIWKRGNWICIRKSDGGHTQELRIRENLLERIDYFGEPLIIVEQSKCKK